MDTIGNIIDKLFTVNLKLMHNINVDKLNNLRFQKKALMTEINVGIQRIWSEDLAAIDILRPQHKTY